jgi:transposase InsO family protein
VTGRFDLASRKVVGWAVADHLRTDLVDAALRDALARRRPASGLVFHLDRGCQYTSDQHARLAAAHGVRLSVGRLPGHQLGRQPPRSVPGQRGRQIILRDHQDRVAAPPGMTDPPTVKWFFCHIHR